MKLYPLRKYVEMGTEFTQERYRAFYISAIGTDDTADVEAIIQARKTTKFSNAIAPNRILSTNRQTPAPLTDLPLIIPPEATYEFTGTGGTYVLLIGKMAALEPGEAMPADWATRFNQQHIRFRKAIETKAVGTGTDWAAGKEITLLTLRPTSVEKYVIDSRIGVQIVTAGTTTVKEGDISIYMTLDGEPIDLVAPTGRRYGWPLFAFQCPPNDTYSAEPVSFKNTPITVEPDHTLEVIARNVSGTALFTTAQAELRFWAWADYTKFL